LKNTCLGQFSVPNAELTITQPLLDQNYVKFSVLNGFSGSLRRPKRRFSHVCLCLLTSAHVNSHLLAYLETFLKVVKKRQLSLGCGSPRFPAMGFRLIMRIMPLNTASHISRSGTLKIASESPTQSNYQKNMHKHLKMNILR
jgi:hypothetical protein